MDPMDIVGKSKEDVSLPKCKLTVPGLPLRSRRILAPFIVLKFDAIRGCRVDGRVLLGQNNLVSWVWFA
jgi:hypothetical protein